MAVLFQFFYYRFLHPSDHVRLSTKENISSIVHIRPLTHFDRIKRTKSCEEMISKQNDLQNFSENNELSETASLHFDNSNDERRHNRFAKENRQKLISQQQVIDQKVRLTRLDEAAKRQNRRSRGFLTKISTKFKQPTSIINEPIDDTNNHQQLFNLSHDDQKENSTKRTSQYHQRSKMYNINEDTHSLDGNQNTHTNNINIDNGDEMILTATKLTSHIMPSSSSTAAINNKASTTNTSLC